MKMKISTPSFEGQFVVVLTGAGISQESGLKTFRDSDGLWEGHRVEDVATPQAFLRHPEIVHKFYNERRRQLTQVEPNLAHQALADFEKQHSGGFMLITQNVDDLHERAGSKNVIHMHGELKKARCLDTEKVYTWTQDLELHTPHPDYPTKQGRLRPHICWFGEIPYQMDEIQEAVEKADIFVTIGSSGAVYPAAGLVHIVPSHCKTFLLNLDSAENSRGFQHIHLGPATETVPAFCRL